MSSLFSCSALFLFFLFRFRECNEVLSFKYRPGWYEGKRRALADNGEKKILGFLKPQLSIDDPGRILGSSSERPGGFRSGRWRMKGKRPIKLFLFFSGRIFWWLADWPAARAVNTS